MPVTDKDGSVQTLVNLGPFRRKLQFFKNVEFEALNVEAKVAARSEYLEILCRSVGKIILVLANFRSCVYRCSLILKLVKILAQGSARHLSEVQANTLKKKNHVN